MIAPGPALPIVAAATVPLAALVAELRQSWIEGSATAVAVVLVVAIVDVVRAASPDGIVVERLVPRSVVLESEAHIEWRVTNPTDRTQRVRIADEFAPSLGAERRATMSIPSHTTATVRSPFRPARRGLFTIDTMTVRVEGPWRVLGRQRDRSLPTELRVVPVFRSKREVELRLHRARLLEVGARSVQARGGGTEFDHLREYTVDDSYRHIDWAATARSSHPIVRSYRAEQHQTVIVMLDNGRMMAARSGGVTRLEHGMDAVMALSAVSSRIGDRLGLVPFDAVPHRVLAPGRGRAHTGALTEAMFALEPRLSESDYDRAAATVLARFRRRALVIVLTDLVAPVVEASIRPAVAALAARHRVVVGAVASTEVAEWARQTPSSVEDAYRSGAATLALESRVDAAASLRALGATVIDVEAGRLGPELVDVYLEAKARGS